MTDVHTTLLEARAWDGQTNDQGINIIKFCEGWPKGGKPYVCPAKFVNGSYVRTTKEQRTSGGSGEGVGRQSGYFQTW